MSAPVLITGATGFLGHTLCPYLIERGYQLRALVRPSSTWDFLRPLSVELVWGDICDAKSVAGLLRVLTERGFGRDSKF